jgi:hypothetical protein
MQLSVMTIPSKLPCSRLTVVHEKQYSSRISPLTKRNCLHLCAHCPLMSY